MRDVFIEINNNNLAMPKDKMKFNGMNAAEFCGN